MYKLIYKEFIKDETPPHWSTTSGPLTNGYWREGIHLIDQSMSLTADGYNMVIKEFIEKGNKILINFQKV